MSEAPGQWARTFAGVIGAVFVSITAFGAVIPVIPRLVTVRWHDPPIAAGAAFTASAVVALLLRPYAGRLSQRFGCRPVLMLGCALAAAVGAGYPLPLGLPGLIVLRMIAGLSEALLFTAGSVWTVALAPASRRGQIIGFYGLALWGGLTVGPALGELLYRTGSYPAVWALAAVVPATGVVLVWLLPPSPVLGGATSRRLLPPASMLPGLSLGAGAYGYGTLAAFGALAMSARHIGDGAVLVSVFSGAYATVRVVAGRVPDRIGPRRVVLASSMLEAAGLAVICLAPSWWVAAAGALIAGGGFTLLYPSLALITIDAVPAAEQGAALGAISSFFDLGVGVAGFVGGAVAGSSYTAVLGLAAAVAAGSMAFGTAAARRNPPGQPGLAGSSAAVGRVSGQDP
jgi:MFS family permease